MQRFYQAVELDEAEISRKRGSSVDANVEKKSKSPKLVEVDDVLEQKSSLVIKFSYKRIKIKLSTSMKIIKYL